MLTPAFHYTIVNDFLGVLNKQSRIMCQLFHEKCLQSNASAEFDVIPYLTNCTLDIICGTSYLFFALKTLKSYFKIC